MFFKKWKYAAVLISNNLRWVFSLVCIIQYFPVFTTVCQCFDSDTDSDSDRELAALLRTVVDSQLNACVFMYLFHVNSMFLMFF